VEKSLEDKVKEINEIKSKSELCHYKPTCTNYRCIYRHETTSGLSPSAEKLLETFKSQKSSGEERKSKPAEKKF
jgi:hypothetical protein